MSPVETLVECTIPVLAVRDLSRSRVFYVEQLGFEVDWGSEPAATVCSVSRDGCCIMLQQGTGGPGCVWIGLEDASLFDVWTQRGVSVIQPPQNRPWAYEMKFADHDGNVLWVGTEPRSDLPIVTDL